MATPPNHSLSTAARRRNTAVNQRNQRSRTSQKANKKPNTRNIKSWQWEGKDGNNRLVRGETIAPDERFLKTILRKQGISLKSAKAKKTKDKAISEEDIAIVTRQIATIMRMGGHLLQAFEIISKGHSNLRMQQMLMKISTEVEAGHSLSASLEHYPDNFDNLYLNMVAVGEASGSLDSLLERLAEYKEKTIALKKRIKKALFYPMAVIVVALVVVTIIMVYVIPAFKEIFSSFGSELPVPTLMVMGISDFMVEWWWVIFGGLSAFIYTAMRMVKNSEVLRNRVDEISLHLPLFGSIVNKSSIAKWTRTLSTLSRAGMPLTEAMASVANAADNYVFKRATHNILNDVKQGAGLTSSVQAQNLFPTLVTQLMAIGEESGALDEMLERIATNYEQEVDSDVDALTSLMEPIIMSVLGVVIGGLIIAMYLPIFKLAATV